MSDSVRKILLPVLTFLLGVGVTVFCFEFGPTRLASVTRSEKARSPEESDVEAVLHGYLASSSVQHAVEDWDFPKSDAVVLREQAPRQSQLPTLELEIDDDDLTLMQQAIHGGDPRLSHDPGGDKPYVPARFADERGTFMEAKVCLRGLMAWHHHAEKPSLRIKLPKGLGETQRDIELVRPKDLLAMRNWLPDQLGQALGLMTASSEHVRLFINGTYRGVYLRSRRADNTLALNTGRLPGAFFKDPDSPGDFWLRAGAWEQGGNVTNAALLALNRLLGGLRGPRSTQGLREVESLLDADEFARWSALGIIAGSSHQDDLHNHVLFFRHNEGVFEALPWDVMGYGDSNPGTLPPNLLINPFVASLMRDPKWVYRRDQVLHEFLNSKGSAQAQIQLLDRELERMQADLQADVYRGDCTPRSGMVCVLSSVEDIPVKRAQLQRWIADRVGYLSSYLADARADIQPHPQRPEWTRVTVYGNVAVRAQAVGGETHLLYPGLSAKPADFQMSASISETFSRPYLQPGPLSYDIPGKVADFHLTNAITGGDVKLAPAPEQVPLVSVPPSEPTTKAPQPVILGPGTVDMTQTLVVQPEQQLTIAPGTQLLMHPNVSLVSYGRVTALGTADAPIVFRAVGHKPWGSFAVVGKQAADSQLSYVDVSGGSVATVNRIFFKGMVSVYGTSGFKVDHGHFSSNQRGDDAVNVASSSFTFTNSHWEDARADALDIDEGQGTIEDCTFERTGNDALDLMGSTVKIRRFRTTLSGDKGISVGEGSTVDLSDSVIDGAVTGIEIKDGSEVHVKNSELRGNKLAIHGYMKHWMYQQGGSATAEGLRFSNNQLGDVDLTDNSSLVLIHSDRPTILRGREHVTQR
jgi:hypothetical protein